MMLGLEFALCAIIILFAGSKASRYGELIGNKTGFSSSFAGLVLLSVVSALSQLVASLSAVVVHNLPDMAVSALMGSSMFNMMVIGLLDLVAKEKPMSSRVQRGHILSAGFGIVLTGMVAVDILFNDHLPVISVLSSMDPITLSFVPIYLLAMKVTLKFEAKNKQAQTAEEQAIEASCSLKKAIAFFVLCAVAIIGASWYLPDLAEQIAKSTGWGENFIGSSFIAIATCLPELSVAVSSARRGAFDMAVASLLGANLCYIVIIAITDFCYPAHPILHNIAVVNTLSALTAMISMAIVVIALTYRPEKKLRFIAADSAALILVYVLANVLLFQAH